MNSVFLYLFKSFSKVYYFILCITLLDFQIQIFRQKSIKPAVLVFSHLPNY